MSSPSLSQEDIRQLLNKKTENKNLDYKEGFNWVTETQDKKIEIIKDILAMANTRDGGDIVFGVRDGDYELVGLSDNDFKSFDQTKVNDLLHNYTDPKYTCYVYKNIVDGKNVVVIDVPEFPEIPIICKKEYLSSANPKELILKKGHIYIRTEKGTSEIIPSAEEMRDLMSRAATKKGDEILHSIERLIKGKPIKASEESKEKYDQEIKETDSFFLQNIGEGLKKYAWASQICSWEISAYPTEYDPKRIPDRKKIRELIEKTSVRLRGWYFPHTDRETQSNFANGIQSYTIWEENIEGYRAYKSGLFIWKAAFPEDVRGMKKDGAPVLSFIRLIYSVTEFYLFLKRYYEEFALDSDVHIKIILNGVKGRKLISTDSGVAWFDRYIAQDSPIILEEDIKVVDLKASYKEIANRIIREIFSVFNCDDVTESVIDQWQTKLLERRF